MDSDRLQQVEDLFLQALELGAIERSAFLADLLAKDPELHDQVANMLHMDAAASREDFLGKALVDWDQSNPELQPGDRVGPFVIRELLGEGGMGIVYRAEQLEPVHREVALKLIKIGMDTRRVLSRFQLEQQTLARLHHPFIAQVFDAGVSEGGRPYFVMELIHGKPITDWCDQHRYDLHARLKLFIRLCEAVHYAHRRGCLHRDLKPANVLVWDVEGAPAPKVIDFGIAKATGEDLNPGLTQLTQTKPPPADMTNPAGVLGSLGYMSPEQATIGAVDVDVRSDVYSLGVILFELLCGTLPLNLSTAHQSSWNAVLEHIREQEPPRPSSLPLTTPQEATQIAERRGLKPERLTKALRQDLDWVVLKALAKNRERRYDSAADLAADLHRYLADEPVSAGPPNTTYRLGKFVRRHRYAATAAALLTLGLLLGVAGLSVGMVRARKAERLAVDQAERATRTLEMMDQFLASADPTEQGKDLRVIDLLDGFADKLATEDCERPDVAGRLHRTIGKTFRGLGMFDRAHHHFQLAVRQLETAHGADHAETLESQFLLGQVLRQLGQLEESRAVMEVVVRQRTRLLGENHPDTRHAVGILARILRQQERYDQALPLLEDLYHQSLTQQGPNDPETLMAAGGLAACYFRLARLVEAQNLYLSILEGRRKLYGEDHPRTLTAMVNVVVAAHERGQYAQSEPMCRDAFEKMQRFLGEDHPHTLLTQSLLANTHARLKRFDQAQHLFRDLITTATTKLGPRHPTTLDARNSLAAMHHLAGDFAAAADIHNQVYQAWSQEAGPEALSTLQAHNNYLYDLFRMGRLQEAEAGARAGLTTLERTMGDRHLDTLFIRKILAGILLADHRPQEAEVHLLGALHLQELLVPDSEEILDLNRLLALTEAALGRPTQAQQRAQPLQDQARRIWGADDPRTLELEHLAGSTNQPTIADEKKNKKSSN